MDRVILHCDLNSFYASVELLSHPELREIPTAVCGDPTSRHGIILAKNEPAKKFGLFFLGEGLCLGGVLGGGGGFLLLAGRQGEEEEQHGEDGKDLSFHGCLLSSGVGVYTLMIAEKFSLCNKTDWNIRKV